MEDKTKIKEKVMMVYKNLFLNEGFQFNGFPLTNYFPMLSNEVKVEIGALVSFEEIKFALFSMNPMKALSRMAFMPSFFKVNGKG